MIANSYNNPLIAMFDIPSVWSSIDDLICTGDGGARLEPLLLCAVCLDQLAMFRMMLVAHVSFSPL